MKGIKVYKYTSTHLLPFHNLPKLNITFFGLFIRLQGIRCHAWETKSPKCKWTPLELPQQHSYYFTTWLNMNLPICTSIHTNVFAFAYSLPEFVLYIMRNWEGVASILFLSKEETINLNLTAFWTGALLFSFVALIAPHTHTHTHWNTHTIWRVVVGLLTSPSALRAVAKLFCCCPSLWIFIRSLTSRFCCPLLD